MSINPHLLITTRRTVFALEYQSLTSSSDPTVTIFRPGLSRNADLAASQPVRL